MDDKTSGACLTAPGSHASHHAPSDHGASRFDPSRGRVIYMRRYRRSEIRANRDRLYVFGDNVSTLGRGGQAKECRGEPNAVGIPTKWHPMMNEQSFFTDDALATVAPRIKAEFRRLDAHLQAGGDVVWPSDGIGTGLAQLHRRAPAVAAFIERCRLHLARDRDAGSAGDAQRLHSEGAAARPDRDRPQSSTEQSS